MGLFAPKNSAPAPVIYSGLNVSSSQFDLPIPIFWGQRRLATNAIWYNNFQRHNQGGKGKGGDGKGEQVYDYTASTIVALCEGQIDSIARAWAQGSTTTTTTLSGLGQVFFNGSATQTPWSYVVSQFPSQAQSYARTAYLGCEKMDLGSAASIPDNQYECIRANGFSYTPSSPGWINPNTHGQVSAIDCLPSDIIFDLLTNLQYGMGFQSADIDSGSFAQYASYCRALGILFSPLLNSQEKATETIDRWAQLSNSWIFWDGNAVRFVPLGDGALSANGATYTPDTDVIYNLDVGDFLGDTPVTVDRKDPADCYNRARLDICDRTIGYVTNPFEYKDQTLVDEFGLRDNSSVQADEICNPLVAQIVVQLIGKRSAYLRNTYKFKTSYRFLLLLPGDIVTLTEPNIGLSRLPVRITSISENDNDSTLDIEAEEFPGNIGTYYGANAGLAGAPTVPDFFEIPPNINTPCVFEPNSAYTGGKAVIVIMASGDPSQGWGGCQVNISFDGTDYSYIGQIGVAAVQGTLTSGLPAFGGSNPDTTDTLAVDCTECGRAPPLVTSGDAAASRSLCMIAAQPSLVGGIAVLPNTGEVLSVGNNAATGTFTANLTELYRGLYGTVAGAHATGEQFTFINALGGALAGKGGVGLGSPGGLFNNTTLQYALPAQYIGQTIYLKFCSMNRFGNSVQDLSVVQEYQYTPSGMGFGGGTGGVPTIPTGVAASTPAAQQVALSWTANPATDNVTAYELYRANGTGASFGSASLVQVVGGLGWTDTTVAANTGYTYFLKAQNAVGLSAATAGVSVTTSSTSAATTTLTYNLNLGANGPNVAPMLTPLRAGSFTTCKIVTKASDSSVALTIKIKKNGTDIFATDPTVAGGTASGTVSTFTSFTSSPFAFAANDVFSLDVTSGNSNWSATIELG